MFLKLALSMAVNVDPHILLIDDGIAVRDQRFYAKLMDQIVQLTRGGTSLIFASKAEESVSDLCTRGIILNEGKIAFDGEIAVAAQRYRDLQTARKLAAKD
jgi:ABC-type polysaccharide/polyol phosphate transport system ATPase subunit